MTARLVLVYAVDGGIVAGLFDYAHKLLSPSTYPCHLCALTYGPAGQRTAWARALAELGVPADFLHRDELVRQHGADHPPLPAVFVVRAGARELLLSKADIDACRDLDALIALLRGRLAARADIPARA
jgi:hypothetical protein